jgi:hypothetical protein
MFCVVKFEIDISITQNEKGELGLVGYDDCLTRSRSRVRFSELVYNYKI